MPSTLAGIGSITMTRSPRRGRLIQYDAEPLGEVVRRPVERAQNCFAQLLDRGGRRRFSRRTGRSSGPVQPVTEMGTVRAATPEASHGRPAGESAGRQRACAHGGFGVEMAGFAEAGLGDRSTLGRRGQ